MMTTGAVSHDDFLPFGFQYYRSPTPRPDQWERDLCNIAAKGFNCIKLWVQWRSSSPTPGAFDFSDIAELLKLAEKYDLKVILNVIFDVAPAWFYKAFPESKMVAADGSVLEPRALSYRQMGGAPGPCYHHEAAAEEKARFLRAAVSEFRDSPALWVWDLWNEPELTTGIRRPLSFNNQVCYCDRSLIEFSDWLQGKYGSLKALNKSWGRNYGEWSEVEAPRSQGTYKDLVDWRLFMSDALTSELGRRVEIVKELDQIHPVMVHTVPPPIFDMITAGSDDFRLASDCDLIGNSIGSSAWAADLLSAAARGKRVINSEIHAVPGNTALKPTRPDYGEMKRHLLVPMSRGISGFLFWQYRPEILGHESPAWGSTYLDGAPTGWLDDMAKLNTVIQTHRAVLLNAKPRSDGIAILLSPENQIANFAAHGHLDTYHDSVQGAHKLLHDLNFTVSFVYEPDISLEALSNHKCLWIPYPLYMSRRTADVVREWVEEGGIVISECSFGAIQAEDGSHSYEVPGHGFTEVFGVRERWINSIEQLDDAYHDVTTHDGGLIRLTSLLSGRRFDTCGDGDSHPLGSWFQTELDVGGKARVIATYAEDQAAAITLSRYGRGTAVWVGTLVAAVYWRSGHAGVRRFIGEVLSNELNIFSGVRVEGDNIRADVTEWCDVAGNTHRLLFAHNFGAHISTATIQIPGHFTSVTPLLPDGSETLINDRNQFSADSGQSHVRVRLEAGDIQVYSVRTESSAK